MRADMVISEAQLQQLTFRNGSVVLHAVAAGPTDGVPVILLHGFPEFWYGWRHQIGPLAEAGFRVIVPDQRGYNLSSRPKEVRAYVLDELTSDITAVAEQSGWPRFNLAGHDWGGIVGWRLADRFPERLERLAILNVPHPAVMRRAVLTRLQQLRRSWYMFWFQIPRLPEAAMAPRQFQAASDALVKTSRKDTFSSDELARYKEAWAQPGALTGMINWYRAALQHPTPVGQDIAVPTRIIWGMRDPFALPELARESLACCRKGELFPLENATHWVQHEEPSRVNELLIDFFRK